MIDKLKYLIDNNENNPKIKEMLLLVAKYPEEKQEVALNFIEFLIKTKLQNDTWTKIKPNNTELTYWRVSQSEK